MALVRVVNTVDEKSGARLPRWRELPDLELYMDQVLALTERYLGACPGLDSRGLTAAMVNNYVKLGVLPAPVRKRYGRTQLARLLILCVLKPVLPIASIKKLLESGLRGSTEEACYDAFCERFEETQRAMEMRGGDGQDMRTAILCAALRAQAEQALAQRLVDELEEKIQN